MGIPEWSGFLTGPVQAHEKNSSPNWFRLTSFEFLSSEFNLLLSVDCFSCSECNSDFDSERCCCLYHYGEYSTEYTEYKCCSSSSFGNVRFCHYNSPTSSPTSSPTLTPWTEPFDPWTEPFHPWTEPHYDYDDYNSDIPWWGW